MTTPILQEFLRLRLLDIGPEDSRLKKLKEAASGLAEEFVAAPESAMPMLLAAWDPTVGEDVTLLKIGSSVESHWPTFRSAFQGEPITLYRAIALEALSEVVEREPSIAIAVHYVGKNLLPYIPVGKEASVLGGLLVRASEVVDGILDETWAFSSQQFVPKSLSLPKPTARKKASKDYFTPRIEAAVGPHKRDNTATESPNPHFPNSGAPWAHDFSDRITPILLELHDSAANVAATAYTETNAAVLAAVQDVVGEVSEWMVPKTEHLNRMTSLLWWRQASYSESACKAYRALSPELRAIYMALDLARMLPAVYPNAVESFLTEAVLGFSADRSVPSPQVTMSALFNILADSKEMPLSAAIAQFSSRHGERRLMLQIANASNFGDGFSPSSLGIDANLALPMEQWAVWLLREIKALDALAEARLSELGQKNSNQG